MTDGTSGVRGNDGLLDATAIELREECYAADLALHDRFVSFSSELMKLAIGGIGAIGFFLSLLSGGKLPGVAYTGAFACSAMLAVGALTLSAGCSLVHRFLAADGIFHHLRAIKLLMVANSRTAAASDQATAADPIRAAANRDERERTRKFVLSERWLFASATLLFTGLIFIAAAVRALLSGH